MALDNVIGVGITTANTVNTSGDPNVEGILGDNIWNSHFLTYSFPSSVSCYTSAENYDDNTASGSFGFGEGTIYTPPGSSDPSQPYAPGWSSYPVTGLIPFNSAELHEAVRAFNLIQSYTNLIFSPSFDDRVTTVLRLANASGVADAEEEGQARAPGTVDAGDIFFAPSVRNAAMGNNESLAIFHEIGHALGLTTGDHVFDRFGDMEPLSSHAWLHPTTTIPNIR
jgi:hypothetical protein